MKTKLVIRLGVGLLALALVGARAPAQENGGPDKYVTRDEYDKVVKELDAIKKKLGIVEEQATTQQKENEQVFDDTEKELKVIKSLATTAQPGTTKSLLTGYGFAGFTDRTGQSSTFSTGFNPIFLWQLSDRLFFESEVELELGRNTEGEGETAVALEYANLSYIANDYLTLRAGAFLTPFGAFEQWLHPAWINKLPDAPLPFGHDGIAPTTEIGFLAGSGFPVGATKVNYAVYVGNGPRLNTTDPDEAGLLHYDNNVDINNNKAVGTRIGFLPVPQLEVGFSFQYARVSEDDQASAYLYDVDLGYVRDVKWLKGTIDLRSEWVWSTVSDFTYDTGSGPFTFDNRRNGGYAQIAYRPSQFENKVLRNLEGVFRYDMLNQPGDAPNANADENRYTFGLNYWLGPSTVFKAAYQFGKLRVPGEDTQDVNAFLLQAAMGF